MSSSAREFDIIERVFRRASQRRDVVLGIGDDAAITRLPEHTELVTATDTLVCGTHFLAEAPPASVGHRCLAVNLSDLAAMGAEPRWASLAISMPSADEVWLEEFAGGFFNLAEQFNIELIGGDTVRGPLAVTVTLQGSVAQGGAIKRSGAAPGDILYVTGNPGDAVAGRLLLSGELPAGAAATAEPGAALAKVFLYPSPRIEVGRLLLSIASAMIDISDGLDADLKHLLAASNCGASLDLAALPVSTQLAALVDAGSARQYALFGGDDYELCFAVPPERVADMLTAMRTQSCPLTRIGTVTDSGEADWSLHGQSIAVSDETFRHFA